MHAIGDRVVRLRTEARSPAEQYDAVANEAASLVLRRYSTSFGLACRLLDEPIRSHVRNIYAMVRLADELVDAPRPGATDTERAALLASLRSETLEGMRRQHSSNLVVHAFARTAATAGISPALVVPFFDSMQTDLERTEHDAESLRAYIHGSAEVVGLMCLRAFVHGEPDPREAYEALAPAACSLGAAFQKLNFVRDLAADHHRLGRRYLPGIDPATLTAAQRDALLDDIAADLAVGAGAIPRLPDGCRSAVAVAHELFGELAERIRQAPIEQICSDRIRVPAPVKARIVAGHVLRTR